MGALASATRAPALDVDRELAAGLEPLRREHATRLSTAAVCDVATGPWAVERLAQAVGGGYGLLVLEGMAARTTDCAGRTASELLGPGDLLGPDHCCRAHETIDVETHWTVLAGLRVLVLDGAFAQRMAPFPEVSVALAARAMQRARDLAIRLSIAQFSRVDDRLTLLLWHLAERWGTVQADGVLLRLPLTHEMLSQLIAVRRPSVTVGLGELRRRGAVETVPGGWLLRQAPTASEGAAPMPALAS
jgi:CRP-like cAMP-binding protein